MDEILQPELPDVVRLDPDEWDELMETIRDPSKWKPTQSIIDGAKLIDELYGRKKT